MDGGSGLPTDARGGIGQWWTLLVVIGRAIGDARCRQQIIRNVHGGSRRAAEACKGLGGGKGYQQSLLYFNEARAGLRGRMASCRVLPRFVYVTEATKRSSPRKFADVCGVFRRVNKSGRRVRGGPWRSTDGRGVLERSAQAQSCK